VVKISAKIFLNQINYHMDYCKLRLHFLKDIV